MAGAMKLKSILGNINAQYATSHVDFPFQFKVLQMEGQSEDSRRTSSVGGGWFITLVPSIVYSLLIRTLVCIVLPRNDYLKLTCPQPRRNLDSERYHFAIVSPSDL